MKPPYKSIFLLTAIIVIAVFFGHYILHGNARAAHNGIIASGGSSQYYNGTGGLTTFPTIPAAQVQSDWSEANSGLMDFVKNKPSLFSGAYSALTGKPSLATVATSGSYTDLINTPGAAYTSYQAAVSQSGTSAPTGTQLVNSTGTTFTWARTGVGIYTLTASAAVFTANKTLVLISSPNNPLSNFRYDNTSTTKITFTTSTLSVLSLILTSGNSDALFANTLVEVRVYP